MKHKSVNILIFAIALVIKQLVLAPSMLLCQSQDVLARKIDTNKRVAIIETVIQQINKYYIDPEVAMAIEKYLRKNLKKSIYNQYSDLRSFLSHLTKDLFSVSNDRHLGVWPIEMALIAEDPTSEEQKKLDERARHQNYGIKSVKVLPGNIGYLEIIEFMGGKKAAVAAEAAMNFLAGSDALIFDLRRNGGGEGQQSDLILGHIFDKEIQAMNCYSKIDKTTRQHWIKPNMHGVSMPDIPVYVLQSKRTASAAEGFSSILKSSGRGVIVGEQSRGAANPVEEFSFPELSICMAISAYRVSDPVTGTCWEGIGIEPDISTPAEKAMYVACIEAIKKISKNKLTENIDQYRQWALERYKAELDPVILNDEQLADYIGEYEKSRNIKLVQGKLILFESVRTPITLIPLGNDFFAFTEQDGKLEFIRKKSGKKFGIKVQYADNYTISCKKK